MTALGVGGPAAMLECYNQGASGLQNQLRLFRVSTQIREEAVRRKGFQEYQTKKCNSHPVFLALSLGCHKSR